MSSGAQTKGDRSLLFLDSAVEVTDIPVNLDGWKLSLGPSEAEIKWELTYQVVHVLCQILLLVRRARNLFGGLRNANKKLAS